jgi:hypothetical protein
MLHLLWFRSYHLCQDFKCGLDYVSLYVICETLIHHCFAPLLVDKSFKCLSNPIELLLLGMPVLVVKVYYNIGFSSYPHTIC